MAKGLLVSDFFVGREKELQKLEDIYAKKNASLVVIKGRRRIGKSSLVSAFAQGKLIYSFSGLPPATGLTASEQRPAK
jgi:AAA+ ATPase superfamily predicted ATPase